MSYGITDDQHYSDIADAIRAKLSSNATYTPATMAAAIASIPTGGGGGGGSAERKQINFIDYDGTVLHSYTKAEIEAMTSESDLPANPSHSGLISQGWNWTLAQIKAQLTAMPDSPVWVGQMYVTESGKTEIEVEFVDAARLSPILSFAVNGTCTVDWGDGTTPDTVTGTSLTIRKDVPHTYADTGSYTIKFTSVSGSYSFYSNDNNYSILRKNTTANQNRVYSNCVRNIRLGNNASIGINAFYYCYSLSSITIPSGVTSIGAYAFQYCYSLSSITIPSGVTSIGNSVFPNCYSLSSITIPSGVTSIGAYAFQNCYSLSSITIPSGVTSIGAYAFQNCYGIAEYHILPTIPPTLGTNAFLAIVSDCVIYVPSESLEDYQTASNWSTYASYMRGE